MLDHLVLNVSDLARSRDFYTAALAPLGYGVVQSFEEGVGFGRDGSPSLWIARRDPAATAVHVAVVSADRAGVDAFHAAALAAGGVDHGAPGLREIYHPDYYGAFVLDPDGNNLEAVCHLPA